MTETEKTPLSETGPSCAHLRVKWVEEQDPFTKCYTGWWECFDCRTKFMPVPVHKYEIEELERENNANRALLKDAAMQVTEKEAEVTRLREAINQLIEKWRERADEPEYKLHREWAIDQCADELGVVALAASAPQAAQGPCEVTGTERFANPQCKCKTYKENLGPCKNHLEGANGRCVYCDHELDCQPASREIPIGTVIPNWGEVVKAGRAYWVADSNRLAYAVDAGMLEALYAEQAGTTQPDGSGK